MSVCKKIKLETIVYARCSVASCNNVYSRTMQTKPHVVYYPFPYDKAMCEQWRKFCQQTNPEYSFKFICSEHFRPDDYIIDDEGYKKLKNNAIPSVITQKNNIKTEEIDSLHMSEPLENSEYDEYHVYELDECNSEQLCDQTNASVTSDKSNTDVISIAQKADGSGNEDETEDLDETTFELLESNSGIDCSDNTDCFESEEITDLTLKNKMLYEEARTALKLAASIKPPVPPKSTTEDTFGYRVADQLKRITDEKLYNETVWSVQNALREGIERVRKKKMENCAEDDDVIILDSPSDKSGEQEKEEIQNNSITLHDSASSPKSESKQIQNEKDKVIECNTDVSQGKPVSVEDHPQSIATCIIPQTKALPLFTKEAPIQLGYSVATTTTTFSNSAIKSFQRTVVNATEDDSKTAQLSSSSTHSLEKPLPFQKVILQPRELRPVSSAAFSIPEALPRLQCHPSLVLNTNPTSNAQSTSQKTDISAPSATETLPPNITVPIILICPPAANQPNIPSNAPISTNTLISNSNVPFSSHVAGLSPNVPFTENLTRTTPQASSSTQRTTTQPFVATDILRAVSNLLAASIASPKQ